MRHSASIRRASALSGLFLLALAGWACSDSPSSPADPFETPPTVASLSKDLSPPIPAELDVRISCNSGPDTPGIDTPVDLCPTLSWGGLTYWVYTDASNGSSMTLIAYDAEGTRAGNWTRSGARYLWQITVDADQETVTLWGQDNRTIEIPWMDLRP